MVFIWPFIYFSAYKHWIPTLQWAWCHIWRHPHSNLLLRKPRNSGLYGSKTQTRNDKGRKGGSDNPAVWDLLVKPPHSSLICTCPPRSVRHNRAFILDTSTDKTLQEEDLLEDLCGVSLNNGQPRFFYDRRGPGNAELTRAGRGGLVDETSLQKPWIVVHRHYYVNKSCPEFRRTVTFIKDMGCL